ncbi:MAG TPA: N-acetylmuramoyl-L-alanine amidase [Bacillota bacterium]|nr:N-acetylmuramoyl-L-alanine amidase [Bacillota bacterium]
MERFFQAKKYILPGLLLLLLLSMALPAAARPLIVEADLLNVRSGPGTNYGVLAQIPRGTVVTAVGASGTWARVILPDGKAGWVSSPYTMAYDPPRYAIVEVDLLHVRSGPGTNYGIVNRLSRNTAVAVLQEQNSWLRVILPGGSQGWIAGWYTAVAECKGYVAVTASLLNLRSGPGTGYAIVGQMPQGETVAVLARQSGWLKVARLNGAMGWASEMYTGRLEIFPANPQPQPDPGSKPAPASPLKGKTIVIDAGHGGYDPGAVGITGYFEKSLNLAAALELAPLLRDAGARVLLTRWSDWCPSLWERANLANSNSADAFVSIHGNAHPQPSISGTETYYYPWAAHSSRSRILAEQLQRQLVPALGLRDIGVKTANFYVISNTWMPSALVELGFLSNYGDEALLRRAETHRQVARALMRGLENFFK